MPASNVSLSNIGVTSMAPTAAAAGAPGNGALQAGPGAENSFGQWMQQMQSSGGARRHADGEGLPEEGKILPVQRQAEGTQSDAEAAAARAEQASSGSGSAEGAARTAVTERGGHAEQSDDVDVEPDAAHMQAEVGEAEEVSSNAPPGAALDLEAEGEPVAAGEVSAEEVDPEAAGSTPEGANVPAEPVADTESPVEPVQSVAGTAGEGEGAAESDQAGTDVPVSKPVAEAGRGTPAGTAQSGSVSELPTSGARPEVREAALQNRGHAGAAETASTDSHGRQVSAIARSGAQSGEANSPLEPVASEAGEVVGDERVVPAATGSVAAATPAVEAGVATEADADASVSGEQSAGDPALAVVAADNAVETAVVEGSGQVVPPVSIGAPQPDATDRAQSARDTLAKTAGPAPASMVGAQQSVATSAGGEADAGGSGRHGSGAQSDARGGNPFVDLPQPAAAAADKGASARNDAELQASAARSTTASGSEARISTESTAANGSAGTVGQSAQAAANAALVGSAAMQRLQDPAWSRAMGQRAIMMAQYGPRSAEIQLDPPELGAMQIRIHLGAQDQVSVSFSSPHAAVRDAIEQQMPRLKEMFAEQGLELGQSSVSDQSANGGGDDSSQARGRGGSGHYADPDGGTEPRIGLQSVPVGLVDYYA